MICSKISNVCVACAKLYYFFDFLNTSEILIFDLIINSSWDLGYIWPLFNKHYRYQWNSLWTKTPWRLPFIYKQNIRVSTNQHQKQLAPHNAATISDKFLPYLGLFRLLVLQLLICLRAVVDLHHQLSFRGRCWRFITKSQMTVAKLATPMLCSCLIQNKLNLEP